MPCPASTVPGTLGFIRQGEDGGTVLVADVMTAPAMSIRREATVEEAIRALARRRITALPVVDVNLVVEGIISEGDVLRCRLPADPRAHLRLPAVATGVEPSVGELMTTPAGCVRSRDDCADVARTLARRGWKSMPVVDDSGRLIGIVSRSDLIGSLDRPDAAVANAISDAFKAVGHEEWEAVVDNGHVTVRTPGGSLGKAALATAATVAGVRSVRLAADDCHYG